MDPIRDLQKTRRMYERVYDSRIDPIEKLQVILQIEHGRSFTYSETAEFARHLKHLYRTLAGSKKVVRGGLKNKDRLT